VRFSVSYRRIEGINVEIVRGVNMINFEEELKKFHPSLEIEEAEDAIYNQDLTDMSDLLVTLVKESKDDNSTTTQNKQ